MKNTRNAPRPKLPAGGFTLVELLLVIALIALLSAGGFALDRTLASRRGAEAAAGIVASAFREAQVRASVMASDAPWGVHVASVSATVFNGADFASRDPDADRILEFPATVAVIGDGDVQFAKGSLLPASPASLSLDVGGRSWHVRINAEGAVSHGPF